MRHHFREDSNLKETSLFFIMFRPILRLNREDDHDLHLVPKVVDIPPLPPHAFMAWCLLCTGTTLHCVNEIHREIYSGHCAGL
jgi:hypothetical protein